MKMNHSPRSRAARRFLGGMFLAACALLLGARASEAHELVAAVATPDCDTSTIQLRFTGQYMENGPFSVPYQITLACTDGTSTVIPGTASGDVTNNPPGFLAGTFDLTVTQDASALAGRTCLVSGTATLFQDGVQYNTVAITDPAGLTEFEVDCGAPTCGDGTINQPSETCEPPGAPQSPNFNVCRADCTYCGDGIVQSSEECDDANTVDTDGCRNDCTLPPPPPAEGCTPGYWKQSQHFDSWVGYAPTDSFEAVFGRDVPETPTLRAALRGRGGGLIALMRHATAALLNASNPDVAYPYNVSQVITLFQQAFDSGDYETTKDVFAGFNQAGCPLN